MTFKPMKYEDIVTTIHSVDDMPNLKASLGKARTDRVRLHQTEGTALRTNRTRVTLNTVRERLRDVPAHAGGPVDDIIAGVASLDYNSGKPLSASRLHNLLQSTDTLCCPSIMLGLYVDKRQAQRYLAAAKLAITQLSRHFDINQEGTDID